ncbi:hypothetical protein EG329_013299 [Mollisiaceae sp. DMI_Dod_QoI]|nr:hypothetical protein EG329_013299 [Helotiales sp. DMI_Dod_QoI]
MLDPHGNLKICKLLELPRAMTASTMNGDLSIDMATYDEQLQAYVSHYLLRRGNYPICVINRASVITFGLQTSILRTCKQLCEEGRKILYAENSFVFDTRGNHPYTHHRGVHEHDAFNKAILPIHTTILRDVCLNLRKLIIHQGDNDDLWEDDVDHHTGLSNDDRVDIIIGNVVKAMANLEELQLGRYHFIPNEEDVLEQWGKSIRWENFVDQRLQDAVRKKQEAEERKTLEQYIWKDGKKGNGSTGGRGSGNCQRTSVNPFDALVGNAVASAGAGGSAENGIRPSFRKDKKKRQVGKDIAEDHP